jgi:hypothetical protein
MLPRLQQLQGRNRMSATNQWSKIRTNPVCMDLKRAAARTWGTGVGGLRSGYQMMDNFWKYANYKMELQKQQWIHEKDAVPPSLEEMKRTAAEATSQSLTSFNRTPEVIRKTLGTDGLGRVTGAFASFPVDVTRTIANNVYNTGREIFNLDVTLKGGWKPELQSANLNARARSIAALRVAGMIGAYALPAGAMALSKSIWNYDDKDEEAVRNTLPDDRRDNMMVMWKRCKGQSPVSGHGVDEPLFASEFHAAPNDAQGFGRGLVDGIAGMDKAPAISWHPDRCHRTGTQAVAGSRSTIPRILTGGILMLPGG